MYMQPVTIEILTGASANRQEGALLGIAVNVFLGVEHSKEGDRHWKLPYQRVVNFLSLSLNTSYTEQELLELVIDRHKRKVHDMVYIIAIRKCRMSRLDRDRLNVILRHVAAAVTRK